MGSRPRPAGGTRPGRGPGRRADSDRADPGGGPGRGGPGRRKASAGAKADRCVAAPAPLWDPPAPRPQPAAPWLRSCCGSATGARWACARRSSCRRSPPCWRRAARGASAFRACCWSWRGKAVRRAALSPRPLRPEGSGSPRRAPALPTEGRGAERTALGAAPASPALCGSPSVCGYGVTAHAHSTDKESDPQRPPSAGW